jgi:hypothetical protein
MDGWTIGGTLLSALGAAISIWQAYKAKRYRDEILADRIRLALIDMASSAKHVREECKKITTPVNKPMRGVDPDRVIAAIQDCAEKLNENGHRFAVPEVEKMASQLNTHIIAYKSNSDAANRRQTADRIYDILNELVAYLARRIDNVL